MDFKNFLIIAILATQIIVISTDENIVIETTSSSVDYYEDISDNVNHIPGGACNRNKGAWFPPSLMMVSLRKQIINPTDIAVYKHLCSGVLLNELYVLSVRICLNSGHSKDERPNYAIEMWRVESFINRKKDERREYDEDATKIDNWILSEGELMLVQLSAPFEENPLIKFAKLPDESWSNIFKAVCSKIISLGWGLKNNKSGKEITSQPIQCIRLDIAPLDRCDYQYEDNVTNGDITFNKNNLICTTNEEFYVDVGSALVCDQDYTVFAVTFMTGLTDFPQISYRVDEQLDFIYATTGISRMRKSGGLRWFCSTLLIMTTFFFSKLLN